MQFPEEFNNLLRQFHRDFFRDTTPEQAISDALIGIGKKQCRTVKRFLDDLLTRPYDPEEIVRLWWASSADIAPTDARQIPAMLKLIRDQIDLPRVRSSPVP